MKSTAPAAESTATLRETVYQGVAAELLKTKNLRLVEKAAIIAATAGKRIDDALALAVGRQTGAAYAVTGSFTEFGEQISVDVRLIDVQTGKVLPGVYVQGKGRERLGAILAQLQMDIRSRIAPEQRIARIEFRGNRKIESSVIKQVLKSAVGDIFDRSGTLRRHQGHLQAGPLR